MIPKIIHYCWFGNAEMPEITSHTSETLVGAPEMVQRCIRSWHAHMPSISSPDGEEQGWLYRAWNEQSVAAAMGMGSFEDVLNVWPRYVREAYEAKKYAFVSDYVRLWALEREGGLYMDVDFEVYKSFEPLLRASKAFVGREGSKHQPPMLGVMASEAHGEWVTAMLHMYEKRRFLRNENEDENKKYDLTTNVSFFAAAGVHKPEWVTIYPVDYFCPVLTTGEDVRSENTYCEHRGLHSWSGNGGMKAKLLYFCSPAMRTRLIKLKRKLIG